MVLQPETNAFGKKTNAIVTGNGPYAPGFRKVVDCAWEGSGVSGHSSHVLLPN